MPTTQVGAHTIYYDDCGQGHPLLLIAGLGGNRFGWRKQIEPLSQKFRVIAMDNRDIGDSTLSADSYTITDMADDSAGVIKNLKLGPTFVIGWSMGGFIAQELTLCHPELVEKLILVATSAGGTTHVHPTPEVTALLANMDGDIETRVRRNRALTTGPGYVEAHPEDTEEAIKLAKEKPISLEGYGRQLGAVMTHMSGGTGERLSQIAVPTLVIHGDHDPLVPYPNGQFLAAHIIGARLSTYEGVGHLPPIEATERFNREVIEFLSA